MKRAAASGPRVAADPNVYGYLRGLLGACVLAAATLPIAIVANALRVAGTGFLAHVAGAAAADGFFHAFAGWPVFMTAAVMLFLVQRLLRLAGSSGPKAAVVGQVAL